MLNFVFSFDGFCMANEYITRPQCICFFHDTPELCKNDLICKITSIAANDVLFLKSRFYQLDWHDYHVQYLGEITDYVWLITPASVWKGYFYMYPDSKVHGAKMGPTWGR